VKCVVPDKEFIRETFDSITPRYDLLNQILSFGMADRWRKKSCEILLEGTGSFSKGKGACPPASPSKGDRHPRCFALRSKTTGEPVPKTILDLGCGTGKFLECFLKKRSWESATGVDFSLAMLEKARRTVSGNVMWLREDFDSLPFLDESFDLVISGFTLRSVQNLPAFLDKVHHILTPGGKAAFLDLTRPRSFWVRGFFYPYLKFALPLLGWLISGNRKAYGFLSGSVRKFQAPEETIRLMQSLGYRNCVSKSFAFGAATLIIGQK
jgi:demethylmenaquinone methyltransferase/2-methoxy-6-polyprenyl-1,4-benzoquinol methylase